MLSNIIAAGRLRDGDPQALAALCAFGGWAVVSYCERAGAGEDVARAVVFAFVAFRRRAIQAGADAAELERMLLESSRDAVDELRGDAAAPQASRAADDAFARANPRPLSARLATQVLRALVAAAPVSGEPSAVRAAAERSYAEAYDAADPAPAVAGEERLPPASAVLLRAIEQRVAAPGAQRATPAGRSSAAQQPAFAARRPARAARSSAAQQPASAARPPPHAARSSAAQQPASAARPPPHAARSSAAQQPASAARPPPHAARSSRSSATRPRAARLPGIGRLRRLRPAWLAVAGVVALLLVLPALLASDDGAPRSPASTPAPAPPAAASARAAPPPVIRGTPREPLTASGARLEVVPVSDAAWAREIRARPLRPGHRWVTIAVLARNLTRRDLPLRGLGYRLRRRAGIVVGPQVLDLAAEPEAARTGRLMIGARAGVHLGFEVPRDARDLTFAFEPGGLGQPTVLVPVALAGRP